MKSKIILGLLSVLTIASLLTGCGSKKDDSEINIGYFNNITHAQALYMKNTGSFESAVGSDYNVTWTAFNAGPAEVEALFSGDIDIGYIGPVPAVTANVKSQGDVQILSGATKGGAILITGKDSGITSVSDLDGKNVSIPQIGNTQHLCLLDLLSQNGLAPVTSGGSVTVSAVTNADVSNVMERGDIDAALVPEPWGATLLSNGCDMLLDYDAIYMNGQYDVAVVVVRKEFYEAHPDIVEKFLTVHESATEEINNNSADAYAIINAELDQATGKSLDESIISEAFSRIDVSTDVNKDAIDGFASISKDQGFIAALPDDSLYIK